ncbi:MAG: type II toxin-antitoxin system ParD family antitoxin [Pseudomonadota bacterium]
MTTRNVVLTDEQDDLIKSLVASGRYQNASEVLRAGLRRLEDDEAALAEMRGRLRAALTEAEDGARADGSGADAVRRAFANARSRGIGG